MTRQHVSKCRRVRRTYRGVFDHDGVRVPISLGASRLIGYLFIRLDFDLEVLYYQRQPVLIPYTDSSGVTHTYAPELLVAYRKDLPKVSEEGSLRFNTGETGSRPLLCDVMLREDLFENWKELKPRLKAARAFAREKGWNFKILTERDICGSPYLWNARFLLQYARLRKRPAHVRLLLGKLSDLGRTNANELLAACSDSQEGRDALLPSLWRLVALRQIGADLICPVTMESPLWPLE